MAKKKNRGHKTILVFIIFLVGMGSIMLKHITNQYTEKKTEIPSNQKDSISEKSPLVETLRITPQTFIHQIHGITGKVDVARSKLSFETSGKVATIHVDKGAPVKKGAILAELDKEDLLLKLKYKKNSLKGAKLELEKAELKLQENKEKAKTGYLLENKLRDYQLDVEIKKNKLEAASLEVESAQKNIRKAELACPFPGVVLEKKVEVGEILNQNQEAFIILDIQNIYVDLEINERQLLKVKPGQRLSLQTNIHSNPFEAKLISIVPAVQGKANIMSARAKVTDPQTNLLPGMFVHGEIIISQKQQAIKVPMNALFKENDQPYLYLLDKKEKKVFKRKVSLGEDNGKDILILTGVGPNDEVVINSTGQLKDNQPVRFEEA